MRRQREEFRRYNRELIEAKGKGKQYPTTQFIYNKQLRMIYRHLNLVKCIDDIIWKIGSYTINPEVL